MELEYKRSTPLLSALMWSWLGLGGALAIAALGGISTDEAVIQLSNAELSAVFGGAGNCVVKGTNACAGQPRGCQNSANKCNDANSCPLANQQIKQQLQANYQKASQNGATGALGTVNLNQIVCYNTVTCPQTCTQTGSYWYCDAGTNPVAGPMVTPTAPDATTCPKPPGP